MDSRKNEHATGGTRKQRARLLLCSLAAASAGCASNTAPPGWLPDAEEIQSSPHGAWVTIDRVRQGEGSQAFHGELIALHPDSLFLLSRDGLLGFPISDVDKIKVTFFEIDIGPSLWSTAGAVSTASHGWAAAITFPIWVIIGASTSASYSRQAEIRLGDPRAPGPRGRDEAPARSEELRRAWQKAEGFARFPGGIPAHLDRANLRWVEFPGDGRPPTPWSPGDPSPR